MWSVELKNYCTSFTYLCIPLDHVAVDLAVIDISRRGLFYDTRCYGTSNANEFYFITEILYAIYHQMSPVLSNLSSVASIGVVICHGVYTLFPIIFHMILHSVAPPT
jgi:hypothetical protein